MTEEQFNRLASAIGAGHTNYWMLIGTVLVPIFISAGLNTYLRNRSDRRVAEWRSTADLHKEFNSDSMCKIRRSADNLVRNYYDYDVRELELYVGSDLSENAPSDFTEIQDRKTKIRSEIIDLYVILRFYQRVTALLKEGALKDDLVFELFGEIFIYWHDVYLRRGFKHLYTAQEDLNYLRQWMLDHSEKRRLIGFWTLNQKNKLLTKKDEFKTGRDKLKKTNQGLRKIKRHIPISQHFYLRFVKRSQWMLAYLQKLVSPHCSKCTFSI